MPAMTREEAIAEIVNELASLAEGDGFHRSVHIIQIRSWLTALRSPGEPEKDLPSLDAVKVLIQMFREHWVSTGTAIRSEDAEAVYADLLSRFLASPPPSPSTPPAWDVEAFERELREHRRQYEGGPESDLRECFLRGYNEAMSKARELAEKGMGGR